MKLYIVRHGETDWNRKGLIQGSDVLLNEVGVSQAKELREKLKDIKFDICFSSPFNRAKKTAEIICNNKCEIIFNNLLAERNFDYYIGTNVNDFNYASFWDYKLNLSDNGVESLTDLLTRGKQFLECLQPSYENLLIVSHGDFIRGLYFNLVGYDENTNFLSFHLGNCDVFQWNFER